MAEQKQSSSSNRTILIGAAALIIAAAFGGYKVGFDNGEKGLVEAQNKMSLMEAASTDQAALIETHAATIETHAATIETHTATITTHTAKIEEHAATIDQQLAKIEGQATEISGLSADISSKDAELQAQLGQIGNQTTELSQKNAEIERLAAQASFSGNALTDAQGKLADLTVQLTVADKENDDYLKTIMAGMGKQNFNLHVGGVHKSLIENQVELGLSYVSLDKKMARITLAGEQMNVNLQSPETIRVKGNPCNLTLANLVSDTEARFQFSCDR